MGEGQKKNTLLQFMSMYCFIQKILTALILFLFLKRKTQSQDITS